MMQTVTIRDETLSGNVQHSFDLSLATEQLSVRELIRERVCDEVDRFNAKPARMFRGLVRPNSTETQRNGLNQKPSKRVDKEAQIEQALASFALNGMIILIDNRQVESLDEVLNLREDSVITFLKLMPLVGG